jgi:hypothetical protein
MSNFDEKVVDRIKRLEREVERLRVKEKQVFVPLTTPLTSTSWDGDSFSSTSKTLIDLSAVFGMPAGVKAVLARIAARDSGSDSFDAYFGISPNDVSADLTVNVRLQGHANDQILEMTSVCPCNADGDVYAQTKASGSGTLDCWLWIWGYWL